MSENRLEMEKIQKRRSVFVMINLEDVELHLFCNMFFGGRVARRRALVGDWRTVEGVAGFFAAGSAFEAFL